MEGPPPDFFSSAAQIKLNAKFTEDMQNDVNTRNYSNYSNFGEGGTYILAKNSSYTPGDDDDLLDTVSLLSMNDD
eukprot:4971823-Ditylum_brightwellii.AAC.1